MNEQKKDPYANVRVVRKGKPGESAGNPVPLDSLNGPRASEVQRQIRAHLDNGTAHGSVQVDDVTYSFEAIEQGE